MRRHLRPLKSVSGTVWADVMDAKRKRMPAINFGRIAQAYRSLASPMRHLLIHALRPMEKIERRGLSPNWTKLRVRLNVVPAAEERAAASGAPVMDLVLI